jgi:transposase
VTQITTLGLDLGKRVFHVHGVDAAGEPVLRQRLQRGQVAGFCAAPAPCLVGIEACASAHYWARLIATYGHQVRLIPPAYVQPYVRRTNSPFAKG